MIVIKNEIGETVCECVKAERVDEQGESGLIKVYINEFEFYYIGEIDRDKYTIEEVVSGT